jgi:hypothetical protein
VLQILWEKAFGFDEDCQVSVTVDDSLAYPVALYVNEQDEVLLTAVEAIRLGKALRHAGHLARVRVYQLGDDVVLP